MDQQFLFNHQSLKEKNKQKHSGSSTKTYETNKKRAKLQPPTKIKHKNSNYEDGWYA